MTRLPVIAFAALMLAFTLSPAKAHEEIPLVVRTSAAGFAATVERLQAEIAKAGAKVLATIDHARAAGSIERALRPTTVVIFGNPAVGTPLMQDNQQAGLDLPLRVIVWEDESQTVQLGYWPAARLLRDHALDRHLETARKIDKVLGAITAAAAR